LPSVLRYLASAAILGVDGQCDYEEVAANRLAKTEVWQSRAVTAASDRATATEARRAPPVAWAWAVPAALSPSWTPGRAGPPGRWMAASLAAMARPRAGEGRPAGR